MIDGLACANIVGNVICLRGENMSAIGDSGSSKDILRGYLILFTEGVTSTLVRGSFRIGKYA